VEKGSLYNHVKEKSSSTADLAIVIAEYQRMSIECLLMTSWLGEEK
jgi:hypothetical protein